MPTLNGNPTTFKGGTVYVTPITQLGVPTANATAIQLVIKEGNVDDDGNEVECDTNVFGRLMTSGNKRTGIDLTAYISQANLTAPLSAGTAWPMEMGDYLTANITSGMYNLQGKFMISKQSTALDPNSDLHLELTLASHGNVTVRQVGVVTAS